MAARSLVFTSTTDALGDGVSRLLIAQIQDSAGLIQVDDSTTPVTLTQSGAGGVIGLGVVTAIAGIIQAQVTASAIGSVTITGAYDSTLDNGSTTFTIHPYHLVFTSSPGAFQIGSNRLLVAEIRDNAEAVRTTDNTTVVTFAQSGTGTVSNTGTATAVSGVASRLVTGSAAGAITISATATSVAPASYDTEVANSTRVTASGNQGKWFSQSPFRITLWDNTGTGKGRGTVKAVISDAKYIGVSSFLNEGGEMFFTLPYNHTQIAECVPLERHYRVERWDEEDGFYRTVGTGILQDYEATDNEFVFYGIDYMGVLNQTLTDTAIAISGATSVYTSKTLSTIFQAEMSTVRKATNSRLGFITVEATVNPSTKTSTVFTAGEQRTDFLANLCAIAQAGTTNKVVFGNRIETTTQSYNSFFLDQKYATAANNSLRLVYGANVKRFSYSPNFRSLRTRAVVIATSIYNGIVPTKIWSSFATSTLATTYGNIDDIQIQQNMIDSSSVSSRAAYNLYQASPEKIKTINVAVVDGSVIPFKQYKLGDDIRVVIKRGALSLDESLTLRGQNWIGREDGSEQISFDFYNPSGRRFSISPYRDQSPLQQINQFNKNLVAQNGDQGSATTTGRGRNAEARTVNTKGTASFGGESNPGSDWSGAGTLASDSGIDPDTGLPKRG